MLRMAAFDESGINWVMCVCVCVCARVYARTLLTHKRRHRKMLSV